MISTDSWELCSSTWNLPCVSCGRKFSPSAGCLMAYGDHLVFSAVPLDSCSLTLLACTGGLSRELKKQLEVSTREVLQVTCSSEWSELWLLLPTQRVFGGWADIVSLRLSVQHEAQEEKLPSGGWEERLRVNSQFGNVNATSIINNPTAKEKMLCCKWSCDTGKWQAKLKFHACRGLTIKVLWYTPSNATINSLVI